MQRQDLLLFDFFVLFIFNNLLYGSFICQVYGHRICRYLEIPMALLSTIKDEQHIVAYRLPKDMAGMRRLEIIHRWQEK